MSGRASDSVGAVSSGGWQVVRKRSRGRKRRGLAGGRFVRPAVDLMGAGASRARELLRRLLSSRRERLRALSRSTGELPVPRPGRLEAFQRSIDDLENRAAAFDLPVDFTHFRRRLEALLSVLLEIEDDRLVGEAVGRMQEELETQLARAEAIFVVPETLFGNVDLSRSELARVRAACESGHYDLARVALLEHLAAKSVPEGLARWLRRRSCRVLDEAGLIGRGFLALGAKGWTFFDQPVCWEEAREPQAHAHAETAVLARAYVETRDESYAREAVAHLLEWAARVTPPEAAVVGHGSAQLGRAEGGDGGSSASQGDSSRRSRPAPWGPSCAAARLLNWAAAFVALRGSRAFSPEVARVFLALVRESAETARTHLSSSEATADAALRSFGEGGRARAGGEEVAPEAEIAALAGAALLVTATLFDEFRAAALWREEGKRLLAEAVRTGVLPDGGSGSLTFDGHERMTELLVTAALAAPEEDDVARTAREMLEFASAVIFPEGGLPGEPHSDPVKAKDRLSHLARARDLLGLAEVPRGPTFRAFEESGVFVMRASERGQTDSLVFRAAGPPGIHVASGGREALFAPGPPVYAGAGPRSVARRAGPPCDYVRATFGLAGGAAETREVVCVDRRFWVISARVRCEMEAERNFELNIFPPECLARPDGRRLIVGSGEGSVLVALAAPTDSGFRLEETQTGRRASAAARGDDVHFVTLVYPLHGEETHAITVEPVVRGAAGLVLKGPGGEYAVAFPHGGGPAFDGGPLGELTPDVQVAVLARSDGPWRTLFRLDREGA